MYNAGKYNGRKYFETGFSRRRTSIKITYAPEVTTLLLLRYVKLRDVGSFAKFARHPDMET